MSSSISSMPSSLPPDSRRRIEAVRCRRSLAHFADRHCRILVSEREGAWEPFRLWEAQRAVAAEMEANRLLVLLKARQLGMTWLALAYALRRMLFFPVQTVLLFSRRDDEAVELLAQRLRGMFDRLPGWMKPGAVTENDHEWELANGSRAMAFPCTAGDSYTGTLAVCDEFDLLSDKEQARLLGAVKPTIDGGGQMILLSRPDKSRPGSPFKSIYSEAAEGKTPWRPVFLPWDARPGRDDAWYAEQKAHSLTLGSLDWLHEQYPATPEEALAPRSLDKRIPADWLAQCFTRLDPLPSPAGCPAVPGLVVYRLPVPGRRYVVGADTAEGGSHSNDSAAHVLDEETGEECAAFAGRSEPSTFGSYIDAVGAWYNRALVMVERNNHGHAVLLWLRERSRLIRLPGQDERDGWLSSPKGKAILYAICAEAFRDRETVLHSQATYLQLASIDGSTLRAPPSQHDDRADSYALALAGIVTLARISDRVFRREDLEAARNPNLKSLF